MHRMTRKEEVKEYRHGFRTMEGGKGVQGRGIETLLWFPDVFEVLY